MKRKNVWRIVQHIYEENGTEPVLTHVFYGGTRQEAEHIYAAHMQTDSFMRGCVTDQRFRDFACHAVSHTEQYRPDRDNWEKVREERGQ